MTSCTRVEREGFAWVQRVKLCILPWNASGWISARNGRNERRMGFASSHDGELLRLVNNGQLIFFRGNVFGGIAFTSLNVFWIACGLFVIAGSRIFRTS